MESGIMRKTVMNLETTKEQIGRELLAVIMCWLCYVDSFSSIDFSWTKAMYTCMTWNAHGLTGCIVQQLVYHFPYYRICIERTFISSKQNHLQVWQVEHLCG